MGDDDMFIKVMPSTRQAFQNEQITVEYQLYFRPYIQPRESRLADSWDAEGFWREELPVEGRPIPRAVVENGLRYNTITLKRVAVFPTRHGTLRIDPLRIETEIFAASTSRDPFGRFFSTAHPFETVPLASPPLVIEVKPLPAGAPSSFSGAVGQYDITTHIDRDSVQVGEGVRVRMRVAGTGNLAMLEAPTFETPGVFERYGPQIEMALDSTSQRVRGAKTFTYTLVPRSNGTFTLPALEYSFFDPRALKYQTMRAGAAQIRVTGTAAAVATGATAAGLPVDDIAGPALTAHWEPLHRTPLHRSPWTYLALALPLLLLGGVAIHHRHATRLATDIAFARRRRAHPLAQRHLKQAAALRREGAPAAFFEELERAVLGFTGNRLNIPERGLTRIQLDAHLAAAGIEGTLRTALQDFLTRCDQGRFAPITPDRSALDNAYEQAHELIAALDDAFERQLSPAHHAR